MKKIKIEGNHLLEGTINISGAKNSAVALIPASILSDEEVQIDNIPNISDIEALNEILTYLGATVDHKQGTMIINPTKIVNKIYSSNYFTTNIYSSTYNNYYLNFVRNVFGGSVVDYNYFLVSGNNNLLFNSYMGVKYLYSKMELKQGYIKIDDNIYLNENYYPLIYANSNIVSQNDFEKYKYPYSNELLMKNVVSNKKRRNGRYYWNKRSRKIHHVKTDQRDSDPI